MFSSLKIGTVMRSLYGGEELVSNDYLCVGVGCVVCLSQNVEEKLQVVSPLGLCPSQWLSGKRKTVLSMPSIVQRGCLVWAKKAAIELNLLLQTKWRTSVPPRTKTIKKMWRDLWENTKYIRNSASVSGSHWIHMWQSTRLYYWKIK